MPKQQKRGSGGNKKHGRSTRTEARKRKHAEQPARTEKNRIRKLNKHLRKHPTDHQAQKALDKTE